MRRFIAYILMALTILLAIGVSATPVFSKMSAGREFTNSYELLYNIEGSAEKDISEAGVQKIVKEFRSRLDEFGIEDYSVKLQEDQLSKKGNKDAKYAIEVSFAAEEAEFQFISKYLAFSGGNFSLIGTKDEQFVTNVFDNSEAYITKLQDTVPYVIIPVSDKTQVEQFIKTVEESGSETPEANEKVRMFAEGSDEEPEEDNSPNVFLVYDWDDADTYDKISKDPHIASKVLMEFNTKYFWYEKSSEEHTEIQYLCGTSNSDGQYDLSNLKYANLKATYLKNMFNASKYELSVSNVYVDETSSGITNNFNQVKATNENLLILGNNINIALSVTLISTLIAVAIITLLLIVFYRLSAIGVAVNTLATVYLTYVVFISMGGLFNIPAIIAGVLLAVASLFTSVFYMSKFKDEVIKGRTIRKANQEASKKSNMATIDASVITAFAGLMIYLLGGAALKPMGIILFFGALFILGMNLIIFKIMMYFLMNTTSFQSKYELFAIEEKDVPSVLEDKKTEPKGTYENVDFTKRSKLFGGVFAALLVAAIAGITTFGILKGSPLNVDNATKDYSVVYVSVNADDRVINDTESFEKYVLKNIKVNGQALNYDSETGVSYQKITKFDSEELKEEILPYHYFAVDLNGVIKPTKVEYSLDNGQNYAVASDGLEEAVIQIVNNVEAGDFSNNIQVSLLKSHETVANSKQESIALATGILIAGASLYIALRFRVSRGIAALVVSGGASAIAYGALVLTRLGTTAISATAMPFVALITLLFAVQYAAKEKEIVKESKEELALDKRHELMKKALSLSAGAIITTAILAIYLTINYFGFGLASTAYLFASILFGLVVGLVAVLTIMGPLGSLFDKLFSKIRLPKFAKKEKKSRIKLHEQPKTSEPEERIYIGIND